MEQNNGWVDERLASLNPEAGWHPEVTTARARLERQREPERFAAAWLRNGGLRSSWPRILPVSTVAAVCLLMFPAPRAAAQRALAPCVDACESLVLGETDFHDHFYRMIWTFHSWMGLTAPDFAATDATGANFQLSDYAGKVVLLNFWATWCAPCQKEMPWFAEFQREYGNQGLAVIGISLDEGGWKSVRPAIEALKINYRVALGNDALIKKYGGVESLPETLLISGDGRILVKHVGITSKGQYEREIVRALWKGLSQAERDRLRPEGL
jgi:thiol-disulfide isomerase/thioredoxin